MPFECRGRVPSTPPSCIFHRSRDSCPRKKKKKRSARHWNAKCKSPRLNFHSCAGSCRGTFARWFVLERRDATGGIFILDRSNGPAQHRRSSMRQIVVQISFQSVPRARNCSRLRSCVHRRIFRSDSVPTETETFIRFLRFHLLSLVMLYLFFFFFFSRRIYMYT